MIYTKIMGMVSVTVRLRGHNEPDRQAAGDRGHHLPQHLPRRQGYRRHRRQQGLVRQLLHHARLRRPAVHRAHASLPHDPQVRASHLCNYKNIYISTF